MFVTSLFFNIYALEREYSFGDKNLGITTNSYCHQHLHLNPYLNLDVIEQQFLLNIPGSSPKCKEKKCDCWCCYSGYFDPTFKKYQQHFIKFSEFYKDQPDWYLLWPEGSSEAGEISNMAYFYFKKLITSTALSELLSHSNEGNQFMECSEMLTLHGGTISFILHQFFFTDYYEVCQDIENYSRYKYSAFEAAKIKDQLDGILDVLYPLFFSLYSWQYSMYPCNKIAEELLFMELLVNDIPNYGSKFSLLVPQQIQLNISDLFFDSPDKQFYDYDEKDTLIASSNIIKKPSETYFLDVSLSNFQNKDITSSTTVEDFSFPSELFLELGTTYNNLLLYEEAIEALTHAIILNPKNKNAYIERGMAYFETQQLNLAIADCHIAKQLGIPFHLGGFQISKPVAIYIPEEKVEFSKGLVSGILGGAKTSAVDFIPSFCSSCHGILNGLWAFACSPKEVSNEMISTAFAMGEYVSQNSAADCLKFVVPELRELSLKWNNIDDFSKGQQIGYLIGKYGLDIFGPGCALKGVSKLKALKRANTMSIFESCASSDVQKMKIIEECTKKAAARESFIAEAVKNKKILVKNANAPYHIMQKKHAWDSVIPVSGNIEVDFARVTKYLEDNNIYDVKFLVGEPRLFPEAMPKISKVVHEKKVNTLKIHVEFETHLETGVTYLQDAWIVTYD